MIAVTVAVLGIRSSTPSDVPVEGPEQHVRQEPH